MTSRFCVAVVDDDPIARTLLANLLERDHDVAAFESGEALLAAKPWVDAVLLDIEMRGMSGFDTCRQYRMLEEHGTTPVIFVSGHDEPEQRLAAFEAGGDDFIIKPIVADEVRHKVQAVLQQQERIRVLAAESEQARRAASRAESSMGDWGAIIEFMRASASVADYPGLAAKLCQALQTLGLKAVVQIRGEDGRHECATDSAQYPLQMSVMNVMRDMGRMFEMKSRGIVNFPHVSLLIQNLPVENPEKHGRVRDLLAMLGESADARVAGIDLARREMRSRAEIQQVRAALEGTLVRAATDVQAKREAVATRMQDIASDISRSLKGSGVSSIQEAIVMDRIAEGRNDLVGLFEEASRVEPLFQDILGTLERLASTPNA